MTLKSPSFKKGSRFSIKICGENFENFFYTQDLFYFILYRYFVYNPHDKADFIMIVVAEVSVSDVAHGPTNVLFYLI